MRITKLFEAEFGLAETIDYQHWAWSHAHYEEHIYLLSWRKRMGILVRDEIVHRHKHGHPSPEPCNEGCVIVQVDLEPLPAPEVVDA
jgi:hypothetical protein